MLSTSLTTEISFLLLFIGYLVHAEEPRVYIVSIIDSQLLERCSDILSRSIHYDQVMPVIV